MSRRGISLPEILALLVVVVVIAVFVVPRWTGASGLLGCSAQTLAEDLGELRRQVVLYAQQHRGTPPGYLPGREACAMAFSRQLTGYTDPAGDLVSASAPGALGPYLMEIPVNPINRKRTVQVLGSGEAMPPEGDDSHGWIYHPQTLEIRSDAAGRDEAGVPWIQY